MGGITLTFISWIVIAAVLVAIAIGTRVSGGGNPNYRLRFGPEQPWRSS